MFYFLRIEYMHKHILIIFKFYHFSFPPWSIPTNHPTHFLSSFQYFYTQLSLIFAAHIPTNVEHDPPSSGHTIKENCSSFLQEPAPHKGWGWMNSWPLSAEMLTGFIWCRKSQLLFISRVELSLCPPIPLSYCNVRNYHYHITMQADIITHL